MALGLVARSAIALSAQINAFYRVLKGSDPESVYLRLPTAGSFEVRHSVTNAPVVSVTDAGLAGIIQGGNIVDGTVTSAELADDSIVNADVNSAANIAVSKLAHVGPNNVLKSNGTANAGGQVVNADVAPAAAITVSKLAGGGTINRVPMTTDGTNVVMGQLNNQMIANGQILTNHIQAPGAGSANTVLRTTDGTNTLFGKVTSADIADGEIVNADVNAAAAIAYSKLNLANSIVTGDIVDGTLLNGDVNAAAAIAVTKLAHVGANNVLRSNGTNNVGGPIVTNDMVVNTINADRLIDASITASKLGAGITAPACVLLATTGYMAGPQPTATFTPISGAYTSLEVRIFGLSTAAVIAENVRMQINTVATAGYYNEYMAGSGASAIAGEGLGQISCDIGIVAGASAAPAGWRGVVTAWLHGYASTGPFRTVLGVSYTGWGAGTGAQQVLLKGSAATGVTAPVTRLDIYPATGQWAAGTLVNLYGYL